ncbi:DNA repair RAD52-like protein 1, mitochondrial [Senna tora]|uniref:DNA repair RAD52-like protein 1, mitochondrial n=1 Tax=Senna tora TaxID=362788 RepID=A0A835CCV6_9FABA|nr:DNA repair RAD52-like protein 1, mitochondrial [Senna tora]
MALKLKSLTRALSSSFSASSISSSNSKLVLSRSSYYKSSASPFSSAPANNDRVGDDGDDVVPTSGISRPLSEILKELNKKVPDSLVKTRVEKDGFPVRYIPWSGYSNKLNSDDYIYDFFYRHVVNRIMNLHATDSRFSSGLHRMSTRGWRKLRRCSGSSRWARISVVKSSDGVRWTRKWSGEVRNISYSADGKSVSVVYRVTLYGTDAEIFRESTGTASLDDTSYGDPVQKAEAMAFRRACARFGLGLYLYHEDAS